ncbi:TonB-dependent receptor [Flavobacterium sp.]|uniref:TonB-dependent receptor n=1 Tax=Flavobacterium sp. TaxID=239 RepID=UPI002610D780|nr:TonB-dependent receptor [Flavobacterium sp.]
MKQKLLFITILFTAFSFAQTKSVIKGKITDKDMNNAPLAFANVSVKGSSNGVTTNEKGEYSISLPSGEYVVVFSFIGYETIEKIIDLKPNQTIELNVALGSGGYKLDDVVIKSVKKRNTETAILTEIKEAKQVVSAISAEQMAKGTDGNAAQAIQRIPGITIVDGKFVMIRGLSERYNNVLINGSLAPSTEIDKRTFSFDLVPTGLLDKMVIYKTGSADKPGDFSGGIISLNTIESTSDFTKFDISFGYRSKTTFNDYLQSEGSNTDFVGIDNSFRPLPSSFPTTSQLNNSAATSQLRVDAARSLPNNFDTNSSNAFLDNSTGFSLGRKINLGNTKIFSVNALNYSTSYQSFSRSFRRYNFLNAGETRPTDWFTFNDMNYQQEVRITALSNWSLKTAKSKFTFKNLFNQIGENETTIREGINFNQQANNTLKNYMYAYKSRSIYMGQLNGDHNLNSNNNIDWVVGYNYIRENEPDLRRFRTFKDVNSTSDNYTFQDPSSSNLFSGRYYGNLREFSANNGVNYTYTINRDSETEERSPIKIKAGYLADYKFRIFKSRYVSYVLKDYLTSARKDELRNLPLSTIFSNENINNQNGWVLEEGTKPDDSYKADNTLLSGYINTELPLGKFDINMGVRIENNTQKLRAFSNGNPVNVDNPVTSILPSLNIGYNINEKSLVRAAYSRTVNRPEFREIAPFLFYDFEYEVLKFGNADLKVATIDNIDFRYEWYPSKGETVSFGGFYKKFTNPIEQIIQRTAEDPSFNFKNATSAVNYGAELEIKKSFKDLTNIPILNRLSININASYIFSEVDLGAAAQSQDSKRALQGQSPYIINGALGYEDEKGLGINLIYNRFGNRIFSVGDDAFNTYYEIERNQLDATISKKFKKLKVKLGLQNILNDPFKLMEDSNRDNKISKANDNVISSFKRGSLYTLGFSYNL